MEEFRKLMITLSTHLPLNDYASAHGSLFDPQRPHATGETSSTMPSTSAQGLWSLAPINQPSHTPAWDPSSLTPRDPLSRTPAWDPSARTPLHSLDSPIATTSSAAILQEEAPQHVLLSPHLVGMTLKVVVNGGKYSSKDMCITIANVDGRLQICSTTYNTTTNLDPRWVTPKHPNPTRDKLLLVVIKGEHCGKYVRRVSQRKVDDCYLLNLAVVTRVTGSEDRLSGERLELCMEDLCLVFELEEEKTLNKNTMNSLREEARSAARR